MNDEAMNTRPFKGFEYKEVTVSSDKVSFYLDCYENFGWQADERIQGAAPYQDNAGKVTLRLKRDRKIINKMELTRLQRHFEACAEEIERLEKSQTSAATMRALIVAFIGTAFLAGSVFAVTAEPPMIWLCVLLGIPGVLGWILPYFVYRRAADRQKKKILPLIEEKYDEIYEICQKGNDLL